MSNETLTVKLTVLEDGKIEVITNTNEVVYLQPIIVVDAKETTARVEVKGDDGNQVRVSEDVTEIDGVVFSGNFEALETALREAALKANGLLNGGVSGGGGGSSDTTAANQVILIDQTAAKKIGYVLDIAAAGTPPPYTDLVELIQNIDGNSVSYPIANLAADTTEDLAQIFNDLQKDIYYAALNSQKLYFVPVEDATVDITEILFEDSNEGQLSFPSPYIETTDTPTGALHQLVTLAQQQTAALKPVGLSPKPDRLSNPSNETVTGFKYLVFSCDGANNSITVTQNGSSVTYPQANLDGSLLRGYELPLSKVPYTDSITFNGTGTVDILKID